MISHYFYNLVFILFKYSLFRKEKVSLRNSVALGYSYFPFSDIDLLFVFPNKPIKKDIRYLKRKLFFAKLIFPKIGESAVISEREFNVFFQDMNRYERRRYQIDGMTYFGENKKKIEVEKFVYFLRMRKSDSKNLKRYADLRQRKWSYHFAEVGGVLEENFSEASIEKSLKGWIPSYHSDLYRDKWDSMSVCIDPSWAAGYLIERKNRNISSHKLKLSALEEEVYFEQIVWEIWGLYTQYYLTYAYDINKNQELRDHLKNLKELSEEVIDNEKRLLLIKERLNLFESIY